MPRRIIRVGTNELVTKVDELTIITLTAFTKMEISRWSNRTEWRIRTYIQLGQRRS